MNFIISVLTRDLTLAAKEVVRRLLTEEESKNDPCRNAQHRFISRRYKKVEPIPFSMGSTQLYKV